MEICLCYPFANKIIPRLTSPSHLIVEKVWIRAYNDRDTESRRDYKYMFTATSFFQYRSTLIILNLGFLI